MSNALSNDATVASSGLDVAFSRPSSSGPVSWRFALVIIGGVSAAGWIAAAVALGQLIG